MSTITVTVIVVCTMQNYIRSGCVPPELWTMPVETCEMDAPAVNEYRGCVASAYQAARNGENLETNLTVCNSL